jgi:signal transduction histidine kinase
MRRTVHALTALSCLGLIAFSAWSWHRRVDARESEHYENQLRSLLALDFRLNAEILKARSGLSAHYDGIVQAAAARKRAYRALKQLPAFVEGRAESEIRYRLDEGERLRVESDRLLERFKRDHAVLRNSLRFLPVLARELDPVAQPNAIRTRGTQLIRDALLLQNWQDPELVARIDRELDWLAAALTTVPSPERETLDTVLAHLRIVRERTPLVQELTRGILAIDAPAATQAIMAIFARSREAALLVAGADSNIRFVLALISLAAAAASVILRVRNTAERLQRLTQQLGSAVSSLRIEQAKQKELSELKSRFVAMASHEIRTPLAVIVSSNDMLEAYADRWPADKKREHFRNVRNSALDMARMVERILLIGKHEQGRLKFEPRPLEIGQFCDELVETVRQGSGQRHRVLYQRPERQERVIADPMLLRHMLENLLTNALKYSPEDSEVELLVARDDEELRFEVNDHGIGIDEDDMRHMFETFYRGHNVGGISGTGLGLSIVRDAVELHGGQVAVRSQPDVGTSFMISIPCARSPQ